MPSALMTAEDYCRDSTIHGFKYVVTSKTLCTRLIWVVIILGESNIASQIQIEKGIFILCSRPLFGLVHVPAIDGREQEIPGQHDPGDSPRL